MNEEVRNILEQNTTKTSKIEQLLQHTHTNSGPPYSLIKRNPNGVPVYHTPSLCLPCE